MVGSRWRSPLAALVGLGGAAAGPAATADSPYLQPAYWDELYTATPKLSSGPLVSSWQGVGYQQLLGVLMPILSRMEARRVVVLGAGDSPLPEELSDAGLVDVTAVDFSEEVVRGMRARNGDSRPGLKWLVEDVRKLSFPDGSFSLAIDVGTLDTLATGEDKDVDEMLQQVRRVLRADGAFVSVSSEPPFFRARLLGKHLPSEGWNTTAVPLARPRDIDRRIHDLNPEFRPGQLTAYVVTPVVAGAAQDAGTAAELPGAPEAGAAQEGAAAELEADGQQPPPGAGEGVEEAPELPDAGAPEPEHEAAAGGGQGVGEQGSAAEEPAEEQRGAGAEEFEPVLPQQAPGERGEETEGGGHEATIEVAEPGPAAAVEQEVQEEERKPAQPEAEGPVEVQRAEEGALDEEVRKVEGVELKVEDAPSRDADLEG